MEVKAVCYTPASTEVMLDLDLVTLFRQLTDPKTLIQWGGTAGITAVIFVETGLFFGFFFPGDSLLVTAGILAAAGILEIEWLIAASIAAAIVGDQVGYGIGFRAGEALTTRYARFQKHLDRAHTFYEKYGAKTIVLARFVPIVRTFVPAIAGAARMSYRKFVVYNITGGIFWVLSTTLLGYGLGVLIPDIERYLHIVIAVVIVLSISPSFVEIWKAYRKR